MNGKWFSFLPERASRVASEVDAQIYALVVVTIFFVGLIASLIILFSIRYRRSKRLHPPLKTKTNIPVEIVWAGVPLVIALAFSFWGATTFLKIFRRFDGPAYPIFVLAKQWMWKFEHPNGQRELNEVHLPVNRPVQFILISQDVIHDLFIPAFRIKHDVLPVRYGEMWVEASREGRYPLFCAQYCGTQHAEMRATVTVLSEPEFGKWLTTGNSFSAPAQRGSALLLQFGCRDCHRNDSLEMAPRLEGLFGGNVRLEDGSTTLADENYIRESIVNPGAKLARNYRNVMPSYAGRISEEDVFDIVAYLKSVGSKP